MNHKGFGARPGAVKRFWGVFLLSIVLAGLCGAGSARAAADLATLCAVPEDLTYSDATLPHMAAKLAAKQPVRIMVMGSGSSAGMGQGQAMAYPERLAEDLGSRFPGAEFTVTNLSKRGLFAAEMEKRLALEVAKAPPALVIWQTGTVETVRSTDLGGFIQTLNEGIDLVQKHSADVILVDMQYSPHTLITLNEAPYRDNMRWIAQSHGVMLFDRYAMMRHWEEGGVIDFSNAAKASQARDDETVHACVSYLLAGMIEAAVKSAEAPASGQPPAK